MVNGKMIIVFKFKKGKNSARRRADLRLSLLTMKIFLLLLYLGVFGIGLLLRYLNLSHLREHGGEMPAGFDAYIEVEQLQRSADYTVAQSRVGFWESLVGNVAFGIFLFAGLLAVYDRLVVGWTTSFIWQGVVFFSGLMVAQLLLDLPFNWFRTFRLETAFGFNTTTLKLWLSDLVKGLLLSLLIIGLIVAGAFALIHHFPHWWWLWVWLFLALVTLFLMYVSPYLIEPLFFKFEPLQKPELEEGVRSLMERAGLQVGKVQQVDASRRSRHSNAYFTGIGRVKRIVLFDTLLEQMEDEEILAVLAHEVGHWKKKHIFKRLLKMELLTLIACYVGFLLLKEGHLASLLNIPVLSVAGQLMVLFFLGSLVMFPFTPWSSWSSRKDEWQADAYACELTDKPNALATALIKLSRENLANLHPHPWYVAFYYSHPPLVERVARLQQS